MNPVLLLVDLQNDYLAAAGLEPGRGHLIERATALLQGCRERAVPVIHVWTTVSRQDDQRMPHWKRLGRWICEEGTRGHRPPASLQPAAGEPVIDKTLFSAFSNPRLALELKDRGVDTVLIAGVHLHACVRQTALDAAALGFEVTIVTDATGSDDPVHGAISRRYLESRVARFANTEELLVTLRRGFRGGALIAPGPDKVAAAVERARAAYSGWHDTPPSGKSAMLDRLAMLLEERAVDLAQQMAREVGKPVRFGEIEVNRSAAMLRAIIRRFAAEADQPGSSEVILRRRPHGVVAIITPWNNPVYIALGKIIPALWFGNAVVWKPSPYAAGVSRELMTLMSQAGFPDDVVGFVEGGRVVAEALLSHPQVDAVSLTGSSVAGSSAQEICARRRIPLQAELGGNNAAIVWPDCDLRDAARQIADGAFAMAGQRCTANRRVIVHQQVRGEFDRLLLEAASELPSGDPMMRETRVGPLVNARHRARVAALLRQCPVETVRFVPVGGKNFSPMSEEQMGAWQPPAIVNCDDLASDIVQEETFGPVLVVQTAVNWEEAIRLCNGVRQGLAAALFSRSPEIQARFFREAQAGILKINRSTSDAEVDVPFGGWKSSGIGPPEHGDFDRDFYSRPQTCYVAATASHRGADEKQ